MNVRPRTSLAEQIEAIKGHINHLDHATEAWAPGTHAHRVVGQKADLWRDVLQTLCDLQTDAVTYRVGR